MPADFIRMLVLIAFVIASTGCASTVTPAARPTAMPTAGTGTTLAPEGAAASEALVCPDAAGPITTPIVFGAGNTLLGIQPDGSALAPVLDVPGTLWAHEPAWSPDGSTLAFALSGPSSDPTLPGLRVGIICALDRGTGKGRLLVRGRLPTDSLEEAAWTPDGRTLLITLRETRLDAEKRYAGDMIGIVAHRIETGEGKPLISDAINPALSPDGQRLAFVKLDLQTGLGQLMLGDAVGAQAHPIDGPEAPFAAVLAPRWSPDGKQLAFAASEGAPMSGAGEGTLRPLLDRVLGIQVAEAHGLPVDLWVVDANGDGLRKLTNQGLDDPRAAWSPDGGRVAYTVGIASGVMILDVASGQEQRLTDQGDYGGITWAAR
jgi:Tol biopolymer transport system component